MITNSKLENLFTLNHKVTVYVPATDNNGGMAKHIDNAKYVDRIAALMSNTFGGATSTPAIGYWMSDSRGLEKESTTIVFAYAETLDEIDRVIDECEKLKRELNQDTVALEVDNKMYFI